MSKELKTNWPRTHKIADYSMRGYAIKRAVLHLKDIRENINNLLKFGPILIGVKASAYQGPNQDLAEEAWRQKVLQLVSQFQDDIMSATIAYEDAVFFPEGTEEEEP